MKLSEVTGPLAYTNTYTKEPGSYDPRSDGHFALTFTGIDFPELSQDEKGNRRTLQLSMGWVGTPHRDLEAAIADMALTRAQFPEAADQLKIVKLPCVFSSRAAWVDVDFEIPATLADDAAECALRMKRGVSHLHRDAFKQKYNIGTVYF